MPEILSTELLLVDELRLNLSDLYLDKHFLETKTLLRYLCARGHSVQDAETMLREHIEWRQENDLDAILKWQCPNELKLCWPWHITGFDDMGSPIIVLPMGQWDVSKMYEEGNRSEFAKYCLHSMESAWKVIQLKSSEKTMSKFSIIVDLKNLSFRAVTSIDAMQAIVEAVKAFEANYPETLRVGLFINVPYVFEIAWKLIQPFVAEGTRSKLRFLGSDSKTWKEELCKLLGTDQFPQEYGGKLADYGANRLMLY